MGEISFLGYVLIFILGIASKMIWALLGITTLAFMSLIADIVNDLGGEWWDSAKDYKYEYLTKFFLLLLLGYLTMFFFGGLAEIFGIDRGDSFFWRFFPLIDSLTN